MVVVKKICKNESLKKLLVAFIEAPKAGSPTDSTVFWIHLKPKEIANRFFDKYQERVSNGSIKGLLVELGYSYRKASKQLATGSYPKRDEQFKIITDLILVTSSKTPVISIDCKKKEVLGNLYREGKCYVTAPIKVYDHDYTSLSEGKVIPHGIYDLQANKGYISIGNSSETAEFIADNIRWWWTEYGIHHYPDAENILILCDAGGGNSYRHHIFKYQMLKLSRELGISLIIAHYPPYCSKWNPIEHRLFCHVHRAMSGVVFSDYKLVKELIEKTTTDTGLTVVVRLNLKEYQKGIPIDKKLLDQKRILKHPIIPELSYRMTA